MTRRWRITGAALEENMQEVANLLRAGGVVAYPTETLYGLGADAWHQEAIVRIFQVKGRSPAQALPLIAADLQQVEAWLGTLSPIARRLAMAFWPGPLTLILPAPATLPPEILGDTGRIAVRVSSHALAAGLARAVGRPITATSANLSGEPATDDPDSVVQSLGDRLDGIVDGGRCSGGLPSTIVEASQEFPQLVREGAVPWERVVQFLSR